MKRADTPFRRSERLQLTVGLAVFVIGAFVAHSTAPTGAEIDTFRRVNDLPGVLHLAAGIVMPLGTLLVVAVLSALAFGFGRYRMAACGFVAGLAGDVLSRVMRAVVGRGRPLDFLPVIHHVYLHAPAVTGSGYPSGHTTTAAAFVGGVAPFLPRRARRVAWIAVVLVALARVYVGAHLPLDVVGGFALGVSVGAAVNLVFGTQEREPEQARIA